MSARLAGLTALVVVGWLGAIVFVDHVRFVIVAPRAKTGFEVFLALGQLFGALVLALFPEEALRPRLQWVAAGLAVFGLGTFGFGYLLPLLRAADLNTAMYGSLLVRVLGTGLLAVGLASGRVPRLTTTVFLVLLALFVGLGIVLTAVTDRLPRLIEAGAGQGAVADRVVMEGLTGGHWVLSLVPVGLGTAAAVGATRHLNDSMLGRWLAVATALLAGGFLHSVFWPSAYSSILTTSSVLRLGFAVAVGLGSIIALQNVAAERAVRLEVEREYSRRMVELGELRAQFVATVAHELGSPLAAIRRSAEVLATEALSDVQAGMVHTIARETEALTLLAEDIRASATSEHDDFLVHQRPLEVRRILDQATAFAAAVADDHPLIVENHAAERKVVADPDRIGQVLRNLLDNAAKHTPPGTPIHLRARARDGRVRIEVEDAGPGIPAADLTRIFEKFGRGRAATEHRVAGVGLGLYLSRRILRTHGSDLSVVSAPGQGTTFGFDLEEAP